MAGMAGQQAYANDAPKPRESVSGVLNDSLQLAEQLNERLGNTLDTINGPSPSECEANKVNGPMGILDVALRLRAALVRASDQMQGIEARL